MECAVEEKSAIQLDLTRKDNEDSTDEELFFKKSTVKTRLFDSDEEIVENIHESRQTSKEISDVESDLDQNERKSKGRKVRQFDSESEEELIDLRQDVKVKKSREIPFITIESRPKSVTDVNVNELRGVEAVNNEATRESKKDRTVSSESDDEFDLSLSSFKSKGVMDSSENSLPKISRFSQSDLYDAEGSSDEEVVNNPNDEENHEIQISNIELTSENRSSKEKPKKPNAKSSKTDLQDIHSESQRMVRESRVSLPYHRPRQRSLAEFLQRRKNIVLPVKSLKTSPAKLGAVWKTLEEKAKEAEEFYKSESDSEPEIKEDEQKTEENREVVTDTDGVEIVGKNQDNLTDDSIKESDGSAVLSLEIEKNSYTDGEPEDSSATLFKRKVVDQDKCESESVVTDLEYIDSDKAETSYNKVNAAGSIDIAIEDVLPETSAIKNEVEMSQFPSKGNALSSSNTDEKEGIMSSDIDLVVVLKESEVSSVYNVNNVPKEVIEMEVDEEADGKAQDSNECKSLIEDIPKSVHDNNKEKVTAPLDLEEESMSLRLDEENDEIMPNPKSIYDEDSRLSDPLSKSKQNELQNIDGPLIFGDDENSKSDSLAKTRETVEEKNTSSREVYKSSSEVSDPIVGRKEQLLKAAGIFLSPQLLPSLKAESDVIDLDEDVKANPKKEVGVRDLMQRFIKHHIAKKPVVEEKKVDVGVVVVEGGGDQGPEQVKREIMSVTLGGGDAAKYTPSTERPGARLRCLRKELQREIARKRDEEWAKREQENVLDNEDDEESGEKGKGKCNLDDEEEEELTESSSSEEEEEDDEIEDDIDMSTKSRPKNDFVDEEAEESEDDGDADDEDEDNVDEEDILIEKEKAALKSVQEKIAEKSKLSSLTEEESKEADEVIKHSPPKKKGLQRVKTLDLFSSESDNEDGFESLKSPPSTPFSKERSSGHFHLPSPALPLTALQGSNGFQNSPLSASSSSWGLTQKILFNDEDSPRYVKEEKNSQGDKSALRRLVGSSQHSGVSEDELLNLMSGNFVSHAPKVSRIDSQDDFCLALEDTQDLFDKPKNSDLEESFLDTCNSMEEKKEELDGEPFRSKEMKDTEKDFWSTASLPGNSIDGDSDEDDVLTKSSSEVTKRKKLKKLAISDDDEGDAKMDDDDLSKGEESSKEEELEENSSENEGEEGVESELDEDDGKERIVEYDSEENAVVVEKKKSKARRGLEFLEKEAELSEGEEEYFGSGDEDERGLDHMEREAGDADKLDSEIVRRELERIHMRQVLDEDKREVRLLQEIFLEDGELHSEGMGRERKFRWRNIDYMEDAAYRTNDSGDEGKAEEDDETEEEWRRLRHERETWLREHKKDEVEDSNSILKELGEDSLLVKLGQAALMRAQKNTLRKWLQTASPKLTEQIDQPKAPVQKEPESPSVKKPLTLTKRGSFLSRKDGTLEKLAEIAIKSAGGVDSNSLTSSSPVVNKAKNSRKFIFTVLSPEKKQPAVVEKKAKEETNSAKKNTKRKRAESSHGPKAAKKTKPVAVNSIFQFL